MPFTRREPPPPEPDPEESDEQDPKPLTRVQIYRVRRFLAFGFTFADARELALSQADVHRVGRMLDGGCDHHTALLIEL